MSDALINFLMRAPGSLMSRVRIQRLRLAGSKIGARCWLRKISVARNPWDIELGDGVALDDGIVLLCTGARQADPRISIGANVYINRYVMVDATIRVSIGGDTMIGPHVYITDHDHGVTPGALIREQPVVESPVSIGRNVWIGAGAIILKGVTIGDNAVIGAGSVVTRSVGAGETVVGSPARSLSRQRSEPPMPATAGVPETP